jgi:hypothetical protein
LVRADGTVLGWGPLNMKTGAGATKNSVVPVVLFKAGAAK